MTLKFNLDASNVQAMQAMFKHLEVTFNGNKHLTSMTTAGAAVMFDQFMVETHAIATAKPKEFHHVYEWNHVGEPGMQLFKPMVNGVGGQRMLSWEWRASKTIVPTETRTDGSRKFPEWFDSSKLKKIHIFVWKAPIMEYGVTVRVRPKLASKLVYINKAGQVIFTKKESIISDPGGNVKLNFTHWFSAWFDHRAPAVLEEIFIPASENAFSRSFHGKLNGIKTGSMTRKTVAFAIDPAAASKGRAIAELIAGTMERNYIAMAAQRKRLIYGE